VKVVDEILSEYSLTRETAEDYVDAIVRMNQVDTAEEAGVSKETIRKYKNKFEEMQPMERAVLISELMRERYHEKYQEVIRERVISE
jgi:RNA polymerase-interacting CarD/CdnL/TRCF family regulator